jgi:hypothetical protein
MKFIILLLVLSFSGCQNAKKRPEIIPEVPVAKPEIPVEQPKPEIKLSWNNKAWTQHVLKEIPVVMKTGLKVIPGDYSLYCPNFKNLDEKAKVIVYANLISIMTRYESNYNPEAKYRESFNDSHGNRIWSRALYNA